MALSALWLAAAVSLAASGPFQNSGASDQSGGAAALQGGSGSDGEEAPLSDGDARLPYAETTRSRSRPLAPVNQMKWLRRILAEYPAEAERNGWSGTVSFTVTVTPEGRAADCIVTESSGHAVMDAAACDGLTRHARFAPALDAQGKAVAGKWMSRLSYFPR